jgi:CheY-like chemotaxis protein
VRPPDRPSGPGPSAEQALPEVIDDRNSTFPGDKVVLIVENDMRFAGLVLESAREQGFKGIVSYRGAAALALAREYMPAAITLDINLPDMDGWRVLDRLKDDVATRHIPVKVITTEEERERARRMGALSVLTKPLQSRDALVTVFQRLNAFLAGPMRRLLVVAGSDAERREIAQLVNGDDVLVEERRTGAEAVEAITAGVYAGCVIGTSLPDVRVAELVNTLANRAEAADLPLLVFSEQDLPAGDEAHLGRLSQTRVLKVVRSRERLYDEVALLLHRPLAKMAQPAREMVEQLHNKGVVLAGKKVLVVDDDIRNIFALTTLLEAHEMVVLSSETGRGAIELLHQSADVDVVLMDIMMPEMDGYDTIRAIRSESRFVSLPIIAVTAKAMKGDREKCFEAGASDYISKPVDPEQLTAMLRVWLHR